MFCPPFFGPVPFFPNMIPNTFPFQSAPAVPSTAPEQKPAPATPASRPAVKAPVPDAASYADASKPIPPEDLEILAGMYGDEIEHIYDLYPGQEWMFEGGTLTDRARFLQFLIRVEMKLDLSEFRRNVDEVCARLDNLRTAYAYRHTSRPYRVVLKHRSVDISYESLTDLNARTSEADTVSMLEHVMAQDRMRGFNLEKDSLLRMVVYQTGEANVYAILVSQPHINTDGMSMGMLIQNLFMNYALNLKGIETLTPESDSQKYSEYLERIDKKAELDYWKAELGDYGPLPELPGHIQNIGEYDDGRYALTISDDTHATLRQMQTKLHVTLFNLLQTAWGISLMKVMQRSDIVVGATISGRDVNVAGSAGLSGGFTSILPVRIKVEPGMTFGDLARQVQQRFNAGMKHSHCSPNEINSALGRTTPLFDHMLNMHNFEMPKMDLFSDKGKNGIRFISGTTYVSPSMDLCVLFNDKFMNQQLACHFNYNAYAYSRETIRLLAENFVHVLDTIAAQGSDIAVDAIQGIEPGLFDISRQAMQLTKYKVASALRRSMLNAPYKALLRLVERSQVLSYGYQEIVLRREEPLKGLPVLIEGLVSLSMENREGLKTPFCIANEGEIITYAGLSGQKPGYMGTVESSYASVVIIPKEALFELLRENPEIIPRLLNDLEQGAINYVKQWIFAS